ncbi:MAG: hypothetical protein IJL38_07300 [Bacteroidales bacterium]|nr:hypothetical protein [Bacteroidales bacterium]
MIKNTIFQFSILAVALLLAGCSKQEGVYEPKNKIAAVYTSTTTEEYYNDGEDLSHRNEVAEYKAEAWQWDGERVKTIAYYDADGFLSRTLAFSYDEDDRLLRTEGVESRDYAIYTYTDKHLSAINGYTADGTLAYTIEVTHDGDKITKVTTTYRDLTKKGALAALPQGMIPAEMRSKKSSDSTVETAELEYNGKNVDNILRTDSYGDRYKTYYSYDRKDNPLRGFYESLGQDFTACSRNNVIQAQDAYGRKIEYTYTYSGRKPTQCVAREESRNGNYRQVTTTTTRWEYL